MICGELVAAYARTRGTPNAVLRTRLRRYFLEYRPDCLFNPARSTGPALFVGGWALAQLWLFWVAPLIGGALGGVVYRWLSEEPAGQVTGSR